ncbi:MAG: hypothetical protein VX696_04410 [Pseudomonadota bacterium]|nr:hypothetical protein [Pseudomonadota bacterium]
MGKNHCGVAAFQPIHVAALGKAVCRQKNDILKAVGDRKEVTATI